MLYRWIVPALVGWSLAGPTGTVVVTNMNDHTATIIDAATNATLATLATGQGPHEVAVSNDGRLAVVSNYGTREQPGSSLTVIDLEHLTVARTITLMPHRRPHGIAFFPGDTLLAVTSESSQAVLLVDLRTDAVVGSIPTKGRTSHMLALTADGNRLFTSNIVDGSVTELDAGRREAIRVMRVGRFNEGIAVSTDGQTVWSGSNGDSTVVVLDTKTGAAVDTLRGFGMPYRLAVTPDGGRVIVTDPIRSEIKIIDGSTRRVVSTVSVPSDSLVGMAEVPGSASPEGVAVSRDGRWAFVTLQGRNRMVTVDLAKGAIVGWATTGNWSDGIGYSPMVVRER